ncbi:ComF family protein [Chitiniphilus purpureus]|uniref:ComF family protein n=1 Tax=Chitiniphilus purpureus TaxID=2981137 RepID=A0ABY6DJM6_9NEIS|nr:ComF family protein [Chitiniphilus sp. CD1]UXY14555.1 ComF family protein [Chitiniphilus sp. CD1]
MSILNNAVVRTLLGQLARLAPPAACLLCGSPCRTGLCPPCQTELPLLPPTRCTVCAIPIGHGGCCGRCLARPPAFAATHARYAYAGWLASAIQAGKFGNQWHLFALLGRELAVQLPVPAVDGLVPVPLSGTRLRERGFNQAQELAGALGRHWHLPVHHGALLRRHDRGHQTRLGRAARRRNVRGAFQAPAPLAGLTLLLVDDVMTSGATLDAAARALLVAGAARVECCVLARTL